MNFAARKNAEKTYQIPQNFQQVRAAGTSRFWTLGEAADAEQLHKHTNQHITLLLKRVAHCVHQKFQHVRVALTSSF
jgi:predicted metal-dependent HD superfamily phosphohydrolase